MWVNTTTKGRIRDSLQWAQRLLDEGEQAGRSRYANFFGHGAAMISHFYLGQLLEAQRHGERSLALYDPQQAPRLAAGHGPRSQDAGRGLGLPVDLDAWISGPGGLQFSDDKDVYARQLGTPSISASL